MKTKGGIVMKIFNTIWAVLCVIWMIPLIFVAHVGMFVYACYMAIGYRDVEFVTLVKDSLIDSISKGYTIINENVAD